MLATIPKKKSQDCPRVSLTRLALYTLIALSFFLSVSYAQSSPPNDSLIRQGKEQLQAGRADQALAAGEQAIKLDAKNWEGYALAGVALLKLQRYDEAINRLTDAIERAPQEKQLRLSALRKECFAAEWASAAPQPAAGGAAAPPPMPAGQSPAPAQAAIAPQAPQTTTAQSPASAAEILSWISLHLDGISFPSTLTGDKKHQQTAKRDIRMSMVYQGCLVYFSMLNGTLYSNPTSGKALYSVTNDTISLLDLSKGTPDKIAAGANATTGDIELSIPFTQPIPTVYEVDDTNPDSAPDYANLTAEDKLVIGFATQEMANRQAKAWHDAIVGCKAQAAPAAPENLY